MAKGYNPEIIQKDRVLDLTNNMRMKMHNKGHEKKTIEKRYQALKTNVSLS